MAGEHSADQGHRLSPLLGSPGVCWNERRVDGDMQQMADEDERKMAVAVVVVEAAVVCA